MEIYLLSFFYSIKKKNAVIPIMCTKYQIILSYKRAAIPINKVIPDLASQVLEDSMQVFARLLSS